MKRRLATLLAMIIMTLSWSLPVYAAEDEYDEYSQDNLDAVDTTQTAQVVCNVTGGWSVRIPKTIYLTVGNDGIASAEYTISVKGILNEGSKISCYPSMAYSQLSYRPNYVTLTNTSSGSTISCTVAQEIGIFRLKSSVSSSEYDEGHNGKIAYETYSPTPILESNYETFRGTETGYNITETGTITSNGVVGIGNWTGTMTFVIKLG